MTLISVVVPTVTGREHHLERCLDAYARTTRRIAVETIVVRDRPTCGIAWNEAVPLCDGRYVHLTADDLEPHDGWWEAGLGVVQRGLLPSPKIVRPDGTLESCGWDDTLRPDGQRDQLTRIPLFPRDAWERIGPIVETHYMTDYHFSDRARACGWRIEICHGYLFTHHFAMEGRLDSLASDLDAYRALT